MRVRFALVNLKHAFDIRDQNSTNPSLVKAVKDTLDCLVGDLKTI